MAKKILLALIFVFMAVAIAAGIFARRAPSLFQKAIEEGLGKPVLIRDIQYHFPGSFEIVGFEVKENAPFAGETAFLSERASLRVSPFELFRGALVIERLDVENAQIIVRKSHNDFYQVFSGGRGSNEGAATAATAPTGKKRAARFPIIRDLNFNDCLLRYVDYDAAPSGFVWEFYGVKGRVKNLAQGAANPTSYALQAFLNQGREVPPGEISVEGSTRLADGETAARADVRRISLPYFKLYYEKMTPAQIAEGEASARAAVSIEDREFSFDADLEIAGLSFQAYEAENELFGLKADEVLGVLKDSSGRLKFQINFDWDLDDRSVDPHRVIRKSFERSLKQTVLRSVGGALLSAVKKYADGEIERPFSEKKPSKVDEIVDKFKELVGR